MKKILNITMASLVILTGLTSGVSSTFAAVTTETTPDTTINTELSERFKEESNFTFERFYDTFSPAYVTKTLSKITVEQRIEFIRNCILLFHLKDYPQLSKYLQKSIKIFVMSANKKI